MRHSPLFPPFLRFLSLLATFALSIAPPCAAQTSPTLKNKGLEVLDFRQVVNAAKEKVFPTVVFIKCVQESFDSGDKVSQEVAGSGVIISADGIVMTNWHVIEKAVRVRCMLYDGRAMEAKVLGTDKDTDVGVLQLQLPPKTPPLKYASLGDSTSLKEGDFVMAMGAPWGLARSVSIGIIACVKRYLPEASEYNTWLQTDASISPGNSGGPLVNTDGLVIGLNTRGAIVGGDMGFAIPIDVARDVAAQIRAEGKMNWSWTGLQFQPLKDFDRDIYFEANEGVMIADTDRESPARHAGIQAGDRVVRLGGVPITAMMEEDIPLIRRRFGMLPKTKPVTLEVVRKGETLNVELTPREKGNVEGDSLELKRWDFTIKTINQFDNPDLYFHRPEGVFIFGVKSPGNASNAGLGSEDILLKIDAKEVKNLEDVKGIHKEALENVDAKPRVTITVLRNGMMRQVVLNFSREFDKE